MKKLISKRRMKRKWVNFSNKIIGLNDEVKRKLSELFLDKYKDKVRYK